MILRFVVFVACVVSLVLVAPAARADDGAGACRAQLEKERAAPQAEARAYYDGFVKNVDAQRAMAAAVAKPIEPDVRKLAMEIGRYHVRVEALTKAREKQSANERAITDAEIHAFEKAIAKKQAEVQAELQGKLHKNTQLDSANLIVTGCGLSQKKGSGDDGSRWVTCYMYDLVSGTGSFVIGLKSNKGETLLAAEISKGDEEHFTYSVLSRAVDDAALARLPAGCADAVKREQSEPHPSTPGEAALAKIMSMQGKIQSQVLTFKVVTGQGAEGEPTFEYKQKNDRVVVQAPGGKYLIAPEGTFGAVASQGHVVARMAPSTPFLGTTATLGDFAPLRFTGYSAALGTADSDREYVVVLTKKDAAYPKVELTAGKSKDALYHLRWYGPDGQLARTEHFYYNCDRVTDLCPLAQRTIDDEATNKTTSFKVVDAKINVELADAELTKDALGRH